MRSGLYKLTDVIENAQHLGIDTDRLVDVAARDPGIAEFCRFYVERRAQEVKAAVGDARKRKKLEDDFTPRLELTVVALEGKMHREVTAVAQYRFGETPPYSSRLTVVPHNGEQLEVPELGRCESTGQSAPKECLGRCDMTGSEVLRHLLLPSEVSARCALADHTLRCSLSGQRILMDEAELSAVTGNPVTRSLLKTCSLTGKRAEPEHFGKCAFTSAEVLTTQLGVSEVSGKRYRRDQQVRSVVSGKAGHKEEFLFCHETRQPIVPEEAEQCELTKRFVRKGVLEKCALTGMSVLPSELERCAVSEKRIINTMLVSSSVSGARLQRRLAVRSIADKFCAPSEAKMCMWSGRPSHPDDLRMCSLTGIPFHVEFAAPGDQPYNCSRSAICCTGFAAQPTYPSAGKMPPRKPQRRCAAAVASRPRTSRPTSGTLRFVPRSARCWDCGFARLAYCIRSKMARSWAASPWASEPRRDGLGLTGSVLSRKATNAVKQDARRTTIVLVIVENTLAEFGGAPTAPPVKPLNGCCARRMGVTPSKAKIVGKRLDRVVTCRPFRRLHDHIRVKIDRARRFKQSFDILRRANIRVSMLKLTIHVVRSYFE